MILLNIITFIFFLLNERFVTAVVINSIAFAVNGGNLLYSPIVNEFNQYSEDNNLDITLKLNLFTNENATLNDADYESTLNSLFHKKSNKYDIIFFDNIYTTKYGPYLLDLQEFISKEHYDMYMAGIANQTGVYDNKLVGLPMTIDYTVLYSNEEYLTTYNKTVPKTWDELIETGLYISNEEKKKNNTEFITYNGLFSDSEIGVCSLYEFIYSYRKEIYSEFPDITSQETVNAIEKIKEMKEKIASDTIFKSEELFTSTKFTDGKFLFLKFWYLPFLANYKITRLPGGKEGFSGSTLGGHNLGINKYYNTNKKSAIAKAVQFITSKEMQKKHIAKNNYYSPIPSVYDDDDVCEVVDCEFYKGLQLVARPKSKDYLEYTTKFRNYIYDFLYGNKTSTDVLHSIEDLTKFYHLSLSTDDSSMGLILFTIMIILSIIMLGSLVFLYIEKFKPYFSLLPNDYWILWISGLILIMYSFLTNISTETSALCHLRSFILTIGSSLYLTPLVYKLTCIFPDRNLTIVKNIKNHRFYFISLFILLDTILFLLQLITSYDIVNVEHKDKKIYQKCKMNNLFGKIITYSVFSYKFIIVIIILMLVFVEWNLKPYYYDIRFLVTAFYINTTVVIFISVINSIDINDYVLFFGCRYILYIAFSFFNFIFIYMYRIVMPFIKKDERLSLSNGVNKFGAGETTSMRSYQTKSKSNLGKGASVTMLTQKIMEFHFQTDVSDDKNNDNTTTNTNMSSYNSSLSQNFTTNNTTSQY